MTHYFQTGPRVICRCCGDQTPLISAAVTASPKGWDITKKELHQILWEASQTYTSKGFRCAQCYATINEAHWCYIDPDYQGCLCGHCTIRLIEELGHEEEGGRSCDKVVILRYNQRTLKLLRQYQAALSKGSKKKELKVPVEDLQLF